MALVQVNASGDVVDDGGLWGLSASLADVLGESASDIHERLLQDALDEVCPDCIAARSEDG